MTRAYPVWLLGVLLLTPNLAFAHSPIKGINNFYNGLLHPGFVTSHLLLLIAAGLLVGQQSKSAVRKALGALLVATAVGICVSGLATNIGLETLLLGSAATLGLLVALAPRITAYWCLAIAALVGLLIGLDSGQTELSGKDQWLALLGCFVGINLLFLYLVGLADYCQEREWQKIGVRILGSWIAASALLVLALLASGNSPLTP